MINAYIIPVISLILSGIMVVTGHIVFGSIFLGIALLTIPTYK